MDFWTTMTTLGLRSAAELLQLLRNPQMPRPTADDGSGLSGMVWNAEAVTAFAATLAAVRTNGWVLGFDDLYNADFATLAATTPGRFYQRANPPVDFGNIIDSA